MKLVSPLPLERWQEYRAIRIEATADTPCAFIDTPEEERQKTDQFRKNRVKESINGTKSRQFFMEDDGELVASSVATLP